MRSISLKKLAQAAFESNKDWIARVMQPYLSSNELALFLQHDQNKRIQMLRQSPSALKFRSSTLTLLNLLETPVPPENRGLAYQSLQTVVSSVDSNMGTFEKGIYLLSAFVEAGTLYHSITQGIDPFMVSTATITLTGCAFMFINGHPERIEAKKSKRELGL